MKVLIFPNAELAVARAAEMILSQVRARPDAVLGLATGGTMEPVYRAILAGAPDLSFAGVTTFNLDEYVGLAPDHPQSYHRYMQHHLFGHLDIDPAKVHLPVGNADSPKAEAARYDAAIAAAGGIDLQLLGLGVNGHIGFNEPGSSLGSRTRIKTLTQKTRADNARFFGPGEAVPRYAITMGIETIMEAREVVLIATGPHKAEAVRNMVEGPVSTFCPASMIQFHRHATVILDEDAATRLQLRDYYQEVHPDGAEAQIG